MFSVGVTKSNVLVNFGPPIDELQHYGEPP